MTLLEFQNVSFEHDNRTILENLSLKIEEHDFISIVGPSGSGKSTFLKLCSHLISPNQGMILFKEKSVMDYDPTDLRKRIAYCFQTPYLFGDTVIENINFPYQIRNVKPDLDRVNELFALFHMEEEYLKREVRNLSGGEKQRIALIRSLIFEPEILLLDEVTSALDAENTAIVESVIESLNKESITVLWITHNEAQSRKYANKVLSIEAGKITSLEVIK